ncbi:DNA replication protein DnaC [Bradyrhizobium sp. USDA 4486]
MLFELICARYERRPMLITANERFGEWNRDFPDPAMTLAVIKLKMIVPSTQRADVREAERDIRLIPTQC